MRNNIIKNILIGGHYLFIKVGENFNDINLMELLEIVNYKLLPNENEKERFTYECSKVYITERDGWKHVVDSFSYSLLKHLHIRKNQFSNNVIGDISIKYELFQCFVSDDGRDYTIKYYNKGKLVRHYAVRFAIGLENKVNIAEDFGSKIEGEDEILSRVGEHNVILGMAELIGITFNHKLEDIKCYQVEGIAV